MHNENDLPCLCTFEFKLQVKTTLYTCRCKHLPTERLDFETLLLVRLLLGYESTLDFVQIVYTMME